MRRLGRPACAALLLISAPATAEVLLNPDSETVEALSRIARANLTHARVSDGSNVPPETAEELSRPIVPAALAEQTVRRGYLSGEMEVCGLDPDEQSYLPYMTALRSSGRYTDKQLAFIGLLHGFSQGMVVDTLRTAVRSCSNGVRSQLQRAAARPIATP